MCPWRIEELDTRFRTTRLMIFDSCMGYLSSCEFCGKAAFLNGQDCDSLVHAATATSSGKCRCLEYSSYLRLTPPLSLSAR